MGIKNNLKVYSTLLLSSRLVRNPHPGEQKERNVPNLDGEILEGIQHKYKETGLFFPSQGQTARQ